jgi:hypothetical protein
MVPQHQELQVQARGHKQKPQQPAPQLRARMGQQQQLREPMVLMERVTLAAPEV